MKDIRYNISELFQAAFGTNVPVYLTQSFALSSASNIAFSGVSENNESPPDVRFSVKENTGAQPAVHFTGVTPITQQEAERMSWLGTPILFPILFKKGSYAVYLPSGEIEKREKQDYGLPPATLTDFSRAKRITKTQVLGDTGTVKELFSLEDWRLRIRGFCLDEPGRSAYEQLTELLSWETLADSISVGGSLFEDKSIYNIVIENMEVRQLAGQPGVIPFTIQALSDQPLELQVL